MFLIIGAVGGVALIAAFFFVLQRLSDKTYRPSATQVRDIIEASVEGRLTLGSFDEFSCVRIGYDKRLDEIRERYNAIVDNPAYMDGEITKANSTPLNAAGKARLQELVQEADSLAAKQGAAADVAGPILKRRG